MTYVTPAYRRRMDPATRPSGASDAGTVGFCHMHGGVAAAVKAVRSIERASAGSCVLSACAPCRQEYGLTPLSEQRNTVVAS